MTPSLPADVFGVRSSRIHFSPSVRGGKNECVTNEPLRTSARRLYDTSILSNFSLLQPNLASLWGQKHQQAGESPLFILCLSGQVARQKAVNSGNVIFRRQLFTWKSAAWFNLFIINVSTNNQNSIFVSRQAEDTLEITIFALFLTVAFKWGSHSVVSVFIFASLLAARKYGLQSVF